MLYSKVAKQLKTQGINTIFIVSSEFLDYGYYEFGGVRTPCIDINNINSTSYEILCLIYNKRDMLSNRWSRPYGGVLWEKINLDLYIMELLPENLINNDYKYKHDILYSKVMKQLKTFRQNIVFIVSLEILEYGYYEFGEFGGIITPYDY